MKAKLAGLALGMACVVCAHATPVTLTAASGTSQTGLTLYGQGAIAPGVGSYTVGLGHGVFIPDNNVSVFGFAGGFSGGPVGFPDGPFDFSVSYSGTDTPDGGPNAPKAQASPSNPEQFFFDSFDPSTQVFVAFFSTKGNVLIVPLVTDGAFVTGTEFSFAYSQPPTCTGLVGPCDQAQVGLTPGSSISGPVDITITFDSALLAAIIPEPSTWILMTVGIGFFGAALRIARRSPSHMIA